MKNENFIFLGEWIDNIKSQPVEMQDKILAEIVRYGAGEELKYIDDPNIAMAVNFTKGFVDARKAEYKEKQELGKIGGRAGKKINNEEIWNLAKQGMKSDEIAKELGVSKSSVDHSEGWKNRKNENFANFEF